MLALSAGKRNNGLKAEREKALQKNLDDQKRNYEAQQRVNQAISRFVPNEFLNALGKSNITEIQLGDAVEKEVTICFTDIRNYTSLSEQLSPQDNFKFVNAYNHRMGPIIQNHQGFINQYLGDGIMAIFPQSANDALQAAIEMQQAVQQYNSERTLKDKPQIKVGMGLHSGSLIMGITGDENRLDAATISDSVNSASRIENLTKHYGASILLSEVSLKKLEDASAFHFRYLGQVQVKGKLKPLKIYECFDGDLPEQLALKKETSNDFEKGIEYYFEKGFAKATLAFEKVVAKNPKDRTAKLFLRKARTLDAEGVTEDWTGVEMMLQK
jgi:class 3 adenylate cyclase